MQWPKTTRKAALIQKKKNAFEGIGTLLGQPGLEKSRSHRAVNLGMFLLLCAVLSPQIICWFLPCAWKEGEKPAEGLYIRNEDIWIFWTLKGWRENTEGWSCQDCQDLNDHDLGNKGGAKKWAKYPTLVFSPRSFPVHEQWTFRD